jgi:hypothetical protein
MFKEILKIIPRLETADLNRMERTLTQRFARVAKKFGGGLKKILTGGGVAGIAMVLINKIINPLKEVQDAIDRVLKQGDDLVTNAKQFGTTAGKLFKLQQVAASTGLDEDALFELIRKFQTAVAEAAADPLKPSAVRQYVGREDTAEAFFNFIQALQKIDKNQQIMVQQEVFGEKQILKMADFLQTNFADQLKELRARPSEEYTPGLERLGKMSDLADTFKARQTLEDTLNKSKIITEGMVALNDIAARKELERENERIRSYKSIQTMDQAVKQIVNLIEQGLVLITDLVTQLKVFNDLIKKIPGSKFFRGIMGGKGE